MSNPPATLTRPRPPRSPKKVCAVGPVRLTRDQFNTIRREFNERPDRSQSWADFLRDRLLSTREAA